MRKQEIMDHWQGIDPHQDVVPSPVPYKHEGSTFTSDGIRINGSREFIDSVLSRLKDILLCENDYSRLQLNYSEAKDKAGDPSGSFVCYIQRHERGPEAQAMNAMVSGMRTHHPNEVTPITGGK